MKIIIGVIIFVCAYSACTWVTHDPLASFLFACFATGMSIIVSHEAKEE